MIKIIPKIFNVILIGICIASANEMNAVEDRLLVERFIKQLKKRMGKPILLPISFLSLLPQL